MNFTAFESRLKIDLHHTPLVPRHELDARRDVQREPDAVLRRPLAHHHDAALERLAQRERAHLQLHLARLDLREIQHVVDQREQVVARREDVVEVLLLLRR